MDNQHTLQIQDCQQQHNRPASRPDPRRDQPLDEPRYLVIETENFRLEIEIGR